MVSLPSLPDQHVRFGAAGDGVVAAIAEDHVAARAAVEIVAGVGRIEQAVAAEDEVDAALAADRVGAVAAEQEVGLGAAIISVVGAVAGDELAMIVGDRDVHVEFGDAALIVVDPDPDRVAAVLLVIEQQPVLDRDHAARADVEAAAGVVDQSVGEGRAVRIGRGDGADRGAVIGVLDARSACR